MQTQNFKDILLQYMEAIEKTIAERVLHIKVHVNRVNEHKLQIQEEEVNMAKVLEANLVVM
uniref:hypothetical protein n=1 Tax=Salmonella enterica TaxID=28901 RepID=UPI0020C39CE6